jgi:histidinol phosphatase-like enzyme
MGLLCLDLDGTLVESSLVEIEQGGKTKLAPAPGLFTEPRLRPNVAEVFAIVTNQGGVAWGYATEAEVWARIGRTVGLLSGFHGRPFSVHVCFAHERATIERYREGYDRRKPSPAMLLEAINAHEPPGNDPVVGLSGPGGYLMVGDLGTDEEAARATGVDFVPAGTFFAW